MATSGFRSIERSLFRAWENTTAPATASTTPVMAKPAHIGSASDSAVARVTANIKTAACPSTLAAPVIAAAGPAFFASRAISRFAVSTSARNSRVPSAATCFASSKKSRTSLPVGACVRPSPAPSRMVESMFALRLEEPDGEEAERKRAGENGRGTASDAPEQILGRPLLQRPGQPSRSIGREIENRHRFFALRALPLEIACEPFDLAGD